MKTAQKRKENKMTEEANPIEVTEPVVIEDMTDVKEQRSLMPVTSKLKVRVNNLAIQISKGMDIKWLSGRLDVVDGIESTNQETGMTEMKYINKPIFLNPMDLAIWAAPEKADPATNPKSHEWFKKKQYLVEFKKFLVALGVDVKTPPTINDDWLISLKGRELLVDIQHSEDTAVDQTTGERKKLGTFRERLRNWKSAEEQV